MDLDSKNETNKTTSSSLPTAALITESLEQNNGQNSTIVNNLLDNSSSTYDKSAAVHVELSQADNSQNISCGSHIIDENTNFSNDNNEIIQRPDTPYMDSAESSLIQTNKSIQHSISTDTGGASVSIDNLNNDDRLSPIQSIRLNPGDSKRVRFKSDGRADSKLDNRSREEEVINLVHEPTREIKISESKTISDLEKTHEKIITTNNQSSSDIITKQFRKSSDPSVQDLNLEHIELNDNSNYLNNYDSDEDDVLYELNSFGTQEGDEEEGEDIDSKTRFNKRFLNSRKTSIVRRIYNRLTNINLRSNNSNSKSFNYRRYEDEDLLRRSGKHDSTKKVKLSSRTFRGSYKYSRAEVSMAVVKKTVNLLYHRSTCALFGAFLIHVTLGTVYTLSNINSYMTSYMRKHGSPNATYGAAVWISSSYAIGQGLSMVLGGYLEKRFSARFSCIIGCIMHSSSIMATSWSIHYGMIPVLVTYGLMPGFGCGLAYMTPMSNGFAWFPNRRGLVAGVILAGFGIGTFVFNMAQTGFVNPLNLSPLPKDDGYFTQKEVLDRVPDLFKFLGSVYAIMQLIGCCLLFKPPHSSVSDERPIFGDHSQLDIRSAVRTTEFKVLFVVYGITTQGVLFINSILKEYGQKFIHDDSYLAWAGSMASIANSLGRLIWGLAIDRYSFTLCFTCITIIFGTGLFLTPFEFVLSSKLIYLACTLMMFGSFSGWMSTYPVHLSRVFGRANSGMIYGLIYISQAIGGVFTAFGTHYLMDNYNRFVPFYCICGLELAGLLIYLIFYPSYNH